MDYLRLRIGTGENGTQPEIKAKRLYPFAISRIIENVTISINTIPGTVIWPTPSSLHPFLILFELYLNAAISLTPRAGKLSDRFTLYCASKNRLHRSTIFTNIYEIPSEWCINVEGFASSIKNETVWKSNPTKSRVIPIHLKLYYIQEYIKHGCWIVIG